MRKKILKAVVFALIFALLLLGFTKLLTYSGDYNNYQRIGGFYKEEKNTLDAVYVGSSNVYAFWNPLSAWEDHGIAVYPYSCTRMHFLVSEEVIKEARRTQPDALYIVNLNSINGEQMNVVKYHYLFDYMPFSLNKLRMIQKLGSISGLTWKEKLELCFPLYRYHDRWSEIQEKDLYFPLDGHKGTSNYSTYRNTFTDVSETLITAEGTSPLPDYILEPAMSLMDYCEKENVRVLFVTVPRTESEKRVQELNTLCGLLRSRGFDVLDLLNGMDVLELDPAQDYYNLQHTNIHGSLKFTSYLSAYLVEHYGFSNKRDDPRYASWENGLQDYREYFEKFTLDIERDLTHRTNSLKMPADLQVKTEGAVRLLSWSPVEGADGYLVYRRRSGNAWEALGESDGTAFTDETAAKSKKYVYSVVPYRESAEGRLYGNFDYHCSPAS